MIPAAASCLALAMPSSPLAPVAAQEDTTEEAETSELTVDVFVEIPTGSSNKYEWDEEKEAMILDRVLYSPLYYPTEYGFIPGTLSGDGDPLDALVLTTHPTAPGIFIEVRVIGILQSMDGGEQDDKLLAVPATDPRFDNVRSLDDVEDHILDEIAHFFTVYKDLEGKEVDVQGWADAKAANAMLQEAINNYNNQ